MVFIATIIILLLHLVLRIRISFPPISKIMRTSWNHASTLVRSFTTSFLILPTLRSLRDTIFLFSRHDLWLLLVSIFILLLLILRLVIVFHLFLLELGLFYCLLGRYCRLFKVILPVRLIFILSLHEAPLGFINHLVSSAVKWLLIVLIHRLVVLRCSAIFITLVTFFAVLRSHINKFYL